jgi:amidase
VSFKIPWAPARRRQDPEVRAAVRRLADGLAQLGHEVEPAEPVYGIVGAGVIPRGIGGLRPWVDAAPDRSQLDPRTRESARIARWTGGPVLALARALERPAAVQVGAIFRRFDVVLAPTTAREPMPVGALDDLSSWDTDQKMIGYCPYTWPWNVLGWPAVNVPAGVISRPAAPGIMQPTQLPVGAQLLGPANSEPLLISLAAELEQVERWHERWPPVRVQAASTPL